MANAALVGKVQTVLGLINGDELGIALPHEHLLADLSCAFALPAAASQRGRAYEPVGMENLGWLRYHSFENLDNLRLLDEREAIDEALLFKMAGGESIVDCTINGIGRDPEGLARIARSTGLNIIMGSGYYTAPSHPPELAAKSEEEVFAEIVQDIESVSVRNRIKAGIIGEIGCSWPLEDNERKVLRAAARAQQHTGACLSIHPGRNRAAPFEIVDIIAAAGADMSRVIMCHIDVRLRAPEERLRLAQTGCYLEYDVFGWEGHFPSYWTADDFMDIPNDTQRIYEILALMEAGHLEQILVSQDICRKSTRVRYGGWGYPHILNYVVPMMRQRSFEQEQIDTILSENPKRIFCFV